MDLVSFLAKLPWWAPILSVLGVNVLVCLFLIWIAKKVTQRRGFPYAIIRAFYRPLQMILWIIGISVMVSLYADRFFEFSVVHLVEILLRLAAIISISWAAYLLCNEIEKIVREKNHYDTTTIGVISKLSFITITFLTLLMILPLFGVHIAGLLAFGGVGGIVIGYAAKDALANIFGGIVMALDKPFKIGDWICTADEKIEGIVEHIGWRMTTIRQFDKRLLYVPNQSFSNLIIVNVSQMTHRRIENVIGIRYSDSKKMTIILNELREFIETREDIDQSQTNYVFFANFGESALEIKLRVYTKSTLHVDYVSSIEGILTGVYQIIEKHGAQLAFPTTTIDLADNKYLLSKE